MEEFVKELWQTFHKALLNYIKKKISNPEDARDILQIVFLKLQANVGRLKEKEKVVPWLYQITRNTIIDHYRSNGKTTANLPYSDGYVGITDDMDKETWDSEISFCVRKMMAQLPEKYRSVLIWYEFDGLGHKEIAQRLGMSISASKTRVQRSREKMKEFFLCGCRTETESNKNKTECSYLLKMGKAHLCLQSLDDS